MSWSVGDALIEDGVTVLADDLRRCIGTLVRTVRQQSGTSRSAQSETLDLLSQLGSINVATLAEKRGVTHQTMRLVVSQLEEAGLVHQKADPADRRSRLISISPAGRGALERDRKARAAWIAEALRTRLLPGEQDQLRAAISILDRLAAP